MLVQWFVLSILLLATATSEGAGFDACAVGTKISVMYPLFDQDLAFHGTVSFGTPRQNCSALFDTASTSLWVGSKNCDISCGLYNIYDSKKSVTYEPSGISHNVSIDSPMGKFTGIQSTDTIRLGKYTVPRQTFTEILNAPFEFISAPFGCVLGLGRRPFSDEGEPTLLNNLAGQGLIKDRVLSLFFNGTRRQVIFGYPPFKRHEGEMIFIPVANKSSPNWQIRMDRILFKGKEFGRGSIATIDTGSAYVFGPMEEVAAINKVIGGECYGMGQFRIPCDNHNKLPKPQFVFGGTVFEWQNYIIEFENGPPPNVCVTAFIGTNEKTWTLGSIFAREYHIQLDMDKDRVGIAGVVPRRRG